MIDFQPYYEDCADNGWDDLSQKYWNIQATAHGEIKAKALLELIDEVMTRRLLLPPTAEHLAKQNPTMVLDDF